MLDCITCSATSLDLSHNTKLISVDFTGAPVQQVDVSGCATLEILRGEYANLQSLDVQNNPALKELWIPWNSIPVLLQPDRGA